MPKSMEQSISDHAGIPEVEIVALEEEPKPQGEPAKPVAGAKPEVVGWHEFLVNAKPQEVANRFANEASQLLERQGLNQSCCLAILEPVDGIDSYDLDQIYSGLTELNPARDKDVILFLLSSGGEGEPAYQISKLCKSFSKSSFKVIVPRFAKSAATLLAIGADEIHLGPLGHLGPIDPQIGGLPALGVSRALSTIASVAAQYPRSADMLAKYLRLALTVEQIGYCDRISESAVQYAERLLSTKPQLVPRARAIAEELVHEYKDHSFVIDLDEAHKHLGADWIKTNTNELKTAEALYTLFDMVNLFYGWRPQPKRILVSGGAALPSSVLVVDKKD